MTQRLPSTISLLALSLLSHAAAQCPDAELRPSTWPNAGFFGRDVALAGDVAVVGAHGEGGVGAETGAAYVFVRGAAAWSETQRLTIPPGFAADHFGWAVDLDGGKLVVGARHEDVPGFSTGAVHVYEQAGGQWVETQRLVASDAFSGRQFGTSLDLDGDRLVVGSRLGVYVFEHDGTAWVERVKLVGHDTVLAHEMGGAVAIDGARVAVGAPFESSAANDAGAAYVFLEVAGSWTEEQKLLPPAPIAGGRYGSSLDLVGDRLAVGAPESMPGAVFVYARESSGWTLEQPLVLDGAPVLNDLGARVIVRDDEVFASATREALAANSGGAVFRFERTPVGWEPRGAFYEPVSAGGRLGTGLAVDGQLLLAGAPFVQGAYAFGLDDAERYCIAGVNSGGSGADIAWSGTLLVERNDFVLRSGELPHGQHGFFVYGPSPAQAPLFEGFLCVGLPCYRLPIVGTGPGSVAFPLDLTSPPQPMAQITPGSTWYFQFFYRDPVGGGSRSNLTDGLRVTFCP